MTTGERTIDVETMIGNVTIVSSRGTGWKMDQCPGDWFNVSQYGEAATKPLPGVGDLIEVEVTAGSRGGYWVADWRSIEAEPASDGALSAEQVASRVAMRIPDESRRDDKPVVTRLACLNSAIRALKVIGDIQRDYHLLTSGEVPPQGLGTAEVEREILGLAERFVTWAIWGGHGATIADSDVEESSQNPEPAESESTASTGRRKST